MVRPFVKLVLTIAGGVLILCGALFLFLNQMVVALAFGIVGIIVRVLGYFLPLTPFYSISQQLVCPSCGTLNSANVSASSRVPCPLCGYAS